MRRETSQWSIRMLTDFESRINVDTEYQRGKVWPQPQQALLIDSIIRGFDIPKIFLRKLPDGSLYLKRKTASLRTSMSRTANRGSVQAAIIEL